jgi:hypothetical protein
MRKEHSLWPEDFGELIRDTRQPVEILQHQANLLGEMTGGAITAEVASSAESLTSEDDEDELQVTHQFVLRAKDGLRHMLLRCQHSQLEYPCWLIHDGQWSQAHSPTEFEGLLAKALGSAVSRSIYVSLASRSAD